MQYTDLANIVNNMLALIIALTFHEYAHAQMAHWEGDNTAKINGRLTMNPIPHIDPVGTLLFPLIGLISGAALFGWAKPVPLDTRRLKHLQWGPIFVTAAGPLANLLLCAFFIAFYRIYHVYLSGWGNLDWLFYPLLQLTKPLIMINAFLAVFNLLPIYPLDGGTIVAELLPYEARQKYESIFVPYGGLILLALFFTGSLHWIGKIAMGFIQSIDSLLALVI